MFRSLSILIPAYNVEDTIEIVIRDAQSVGKKTTNKLEILVIDDASNDKTGWKLSGLKQTIPELHIITHTTNQGYGKTIKELYVAARYDWIFSLPGDYQFEAKEIHKLLSYSKTHDMILGWRNKRHDPPPRLIQSKIYNGLLNLLFGLRLHDTNTIRLMKKDMIDKIALVSDTAFVDAELAIRAKDHGFHIIETPILHRKRNHDGATGGKLFKTILPTIYDMFVTHRALQKNSKFVTL